MWEWVAIVLYLQKLLLGLLSRNLAKGKSQIFIVINIGSLSFLGKVL